MKKRVLAMLVMMTVFSAPAKKSSTSLLTPRRKRLMQYFGLSSLAAYAAMNVLNKNAQSSVPQKYLIGYATGIPVLFGLGYYLGTMYTSLSPDKPSKKELKNFITTYGLVNTAGTFGYLCASTKIAGEPVYPGKLAIDAIGYTGTSFGILAASYFASLLWAESGLMQSKLPQPLPKEPITKKY